MALPFTHQTWALWEMHEHERVDMVVGILLRHDFCRGSPVRAANELVLLAHLDHRVQGHAVM